MQREVQIIICPHEAVNMWFLAVCEDSVRVAVISQGVEVARRIFADQKGVRRLTYRSQREEYIC